MKTVESGRLHVQDNMMLLNTTVLHIIDYNGLIVTSSGQIFVHNESKSV